MAEVTWSTDLVIRLIKEYQKRPQLWDVSHDLYRVQTAKYEAWSELAAIFECDIVDLRKKFNSVFASHRREKAKVRCGGKSTWFLYPYMKFLPNHLDDNSGQVIIMEETHLEEDPDDYDDQVQDDEDSQSVQNEVIIKQEPAHSYLKYRRYRNTVHQKQRLRPVRRRIAKEREREPSNRELDSRLLETLRILRRADLSRKKDECDSFGEYIADSLRKHDDRTQAMIKQAINNILFEQEMKKYNTAGQYTVVVAGMDENPLILGDSDK